MKLAIKYTIFIFLTSALFNIACQKEFSGEGSYAVKINKSPLANAGNDVSISLPLDSAIIDGSNSLDPDGTISSFTWTKISGPSFFLIVNTTVSKTIVKNLTAGVYYFELKITDNDGAFAKDTVQVAVLPVATPPPGTYFPLTEGSHWNYFYSTNTTIPDYATHNVIGYHPAFNGNTYSTIVEHWTAGTGNRDDSFYYRKVGGNYYQSITTDFDIPYRLEFTFLKDNVPLWYNWQSEEFSGTKSGAPITRFIQATIVARAVPEVVGGINFPDVIKVRYRYFSSQSPGNPYLFEQWFAKDVGLIKYINLDITEIYVTPYLAVSGYHVQ